MGGISLCDSGRGHVDSLPARWGAAKKDFCREQGARLAITRGIANEGFEKLITHRKDAEIAERSTMD
jgi:hypothetical protein